MPADMILHNGKIATNAAPSFVGEFASLAPPLPPVSPGWSPVARHRGYARATPKPAPQNAAAAILHSGASTQSSGAPRPWGFACGCFAF